MKSMDGGTENLAEELLKAVLQGDGAREALGELDEQVRRNPWTAVAVAAGAGLVVGLLLARK